MEGGGGNMRRVRGNKKKVIKIWSGIGREWNGGGIFGVVGGREIVKGLID